MSWLDELLKFGAQPAQMNPNPVPPVQAAPAPIANAPAPHPLPAPARLPELKPMDLSFRWPDLPATDYGVEEMPEVPATPEPPYQPRAVTARMGDSLKERSGDVSFPKMGMGDSLMARSSGDVLAKPSLIPELTETFEAPEDVNDIFRKEDTVEQQIAERAPSSTTSEELDPELAAAQEAAANNRFYTSLSKRAADLGAVIAGVKSDPNFLRENLADADRPVNNLMTRRKAAESKLDADMKRYNYAFAKDKDDPNSASSVFYRDTIKQLTKEAGIQLNVPDNMSADELEKAYPSLVNLINAKEARAAKVEAAQTKAETKAEGDAQRREDKKFDWTKTVRKEIADANKDTAYTQSKHALQNFKNIDRSKWGGVEDVQLVYAFIKGIDPGSVVKADEVKLTQQGQSILESYGVNVSRIGKGQLYTDAFRTKLMNAFENVVKQREADFMERIAPSIATAKAHDLDLDQVMQQSGVDMGSKKEAPSEAPAKSNTVSVVNKKTGESKVVSKETADKIIAADKNGTYKIEEVK